jgi:uncharacterized protein YwqG
MPHEPNWFLGQINCVDLKDFAAASMLPEHGILSFFGDSDLVTGCIGPWEYGGLYYFWRDDLFRAPEPIEDFETLPVCGLAFSEAIDQRDPYSHVIENLHLDKLLRDRYSTFVRWTAIVVSKLSATIALTTAKCSAGPISFSGI